LLAYPESRRNPEASFPESDFRFLEIGSANFKRDDYLAALDPRGCADGLSKGIPHAAGDTVGSCAGCHLVLPENFVGENMDLHEITL
jgi:hypothetical protein